MRKSTVQLTTEKKILAKLIYRNICYYENHVDAITRPDRKIAHKEMNKNLVFPMYRLFLRCSHGAIIKEDIVLNKKQRKIAYFIYKDFRALFYKPTTYRYGQKLELLKLSPKKMRLARSLYNIIKNYEKNGHIKALGRFSLSKKQEETRVYLYQMFYLKFLKAEDGSKYKERLNRISLRKSKNKYGEYYKLAKMTNKLTKSLAKYKQGEKHV